MSHADAEIELKFQIHLDQRLALQHALESDVTEHIVLRARYYDTAEGHLAAAKIALRLRREGEVWVQTIKRPGKDPMHRREKNVVVAAGMEGVPTLDLARHDGTGAGKALKVALKEARKQARKQGLEGAQLDLKYETDIERTRRVIEHGGSRIEVAFDVGEIRAGSLRETVCEVEFELLSGPVEGLLDLAGAWVERYGLVLDVTSKAERGERLAAGGSPPPVQRFEPVAMPIHLTLAQARARILARTLAHALPNAAAISAGGGSPEHVHQLRVALRRIRTVLHAFGPESRDRDEALAALFRTLGRARDAVVLAETLDPAFQAAVAAPPPPSGGPSARPATPKEPTESLRGAAAARLWLQLFRLAQPGAEEDEQPWTRGASHVLKKWRRKARKQAGKWGELDTPSRHRLRKRVKRLRYLMEMCPPAGAVKAHKKELSVLEPFQAALGDWNDVMAARRWLAARTEPTPLETFAAGWLAREAALVDSRCAAAAEAWLEL